MQAITETSHHHQDVMVPHVDALLALAESIGTASDAVLHEQLDAECRFLEEQLIPHMEMAEANLFPALERLLSDAHALAPLRREHAEVRRLIGELRHLRDQLTGAPMSAGQAIVLRRVLMKLFALLRVHLEEESQYLPILDKNLSALTRRPSPPGCSTRAWSRSRGAPTRCSRVQRRYPVPA
jgi:iron-sulfur cluster repair protein YtfE (RIC family)